MNRKNNIINRFNDLVPDGNYNRLGTTFETEKLKYFFDTGTGKVFECSEDEYSILSHLFECNELLFKDDTDKTESDFCDLYESILDCVEKEHVLQAPKYAEFAPMSEEKFANLVEHGLQQVILELTEKCNLRCKYCIYNEYNPEYRNFSTRDMEWDIAKRAIDYTCAHSGEKVAVTFYGGEPLVKFDLMKRCIEYSQSIMSDRDLTFSFSTNLTLMTREIAQYVASVEGCSLLCSLDGPQVIHDSYRVKTDGTGSFEQAIRGLKYLVEEMGDTAKDRIIINTVVCPPYSKEKLDMIKKFFEELDWLPKEMNKKCDFVEGGTIRREDISVDFLTGKDIDEKYPSKELDPIKSWALDTVLSKNDKDGFAEQLHVANLVRIHNRTLVDSPLWFLKRNGCCIPGNRRIYVQVNGNFMICEKIGESPSIGNVFTGLNVDNIKKYYMQDYENQSIDKCGNCWAANLCSLCYASCYSKEGLDIEYKNRSCDNHRKRTKGELSAYYQLLEEKPEIIEKIKDIPTF